MPLAKELEIREATGDDIGLVGDLWHELEAEVHQPMWRDNEIEDDPRELKRAIGTDLVAVELLSALPMCGGFPRWSVPGSNR